MSRYLAVVLAAVLFATGCQGSDAITSQEHADGAIKAARDEISLANQGDWKAYYARERSSVRDSVSFENFSSCVSAMHLLLGSVAVSNLSAKDTGGRIWEVSYSAVAGNDPQHTNYTQTASYYYDRGQWWFGMTAADIKGFNYGSDCVRHLLENAESPSRAHGAG